MPSCAAGTPDNPGAGKCVPPLQEKTPSPLLLHYYPGGRRIRKINPFSSLVGRASVDALLRGSTGGHMRKPQENRLLFPPPTPLPLATS